MFTILIFLLLSTAAPAQEIPVSKEILKVTLPKPLEFHLDNGLTVLVIEDHRFPEITMRLQIRGAGSVFDPPGMAGLANATAGMLSQGTGSQTAVQISAQRNLLSADIYGYAPASSLETIFHMAGTSETFDRWLKLGIYQLLHPAFPEEEWNKTRKQWLANLQRQRGDSTNLASQHFNRAVFGVHPAGAVTTAASLEAIGIDAMKKWHEERYAPQNAILGVVGDVKAAKLLPRLQAAFASWKKNGYQVQPIPDTRASGEPRIQIVDRPGAVQTTLLAGHIAVGRRDPDYEAVQVMMRILDVNVRQTLAQEHGYSYIMAVSAKASAGEFAGPWQVQASFRAEAAADAIREVFSEIRQLRGEAAREKVRPAARVENRRQNLAGGFAFSLERPDQLLQYAMDRKTYNFPEDYWDSYVSRILAVTEADVQRMARKYLDPGTMHVVAVGDSSKLRPVLEKYGKVVIFDTGGKVLP